MAKQELSEEDALKAAYELVAKAEAAKREEALEAAKQRAAALDPLRDLMGSPEVTHVRAVVGEHMKAFDGDPLVRPHLFGILTCLDGMDLVLGLFQGAAMATPTPESPAA